MKKMCVNTLCVLYLLLLCVYLIAIIKYNKIYIYIKKGPWLDGGGKKPGGLKSKSREGSFSLSPMTHAIFSFLSLSLSLHRKRTGGECGKGGKPSFPWDISNMR